MRAYIPGLCCCAGQRQEIDRGLRLDSCSMGVPGGRTPNGPMGSPRLRQTSERIAANHLCIVRRHRVRSSHRLAADARARRGDLSDARVAPCPPAVQHAHPGATTLSGSGRWSFRSRPPGRVPPWRPESRPSWFLDRVSGTVSDTSPLREGHLQWDAVGLFP